MVRDLEQTPKVSDTTCGDSGGKTLPADDHTPLDLNTINVNIQNTQNRPINLDEEDMNLDVQGLQSIMRDFTVSHRKLMAKMEAQHKKMDELQAGTARGTPVTSSKNIQEDLDDNKQEELVDGVMTPDEEDGLKDATSTTTVLELLRREMRAQCS